MFGFDRSDDRAYYDSRKYLRWTHG